MTDNEIVGEASLNLAPKVRAMLDELAQIPGLVDSTVKLAGFERCGKPWQLQLKITSDEYDFVHEEGSGSVEDDGE